MQPATATTFGEPAVWTVVFNRRAVSWLTKVLACGEFRHVRAFGHVGDDTWVFYDVQFGGTQIAVLRGLDAKHMMLEWCGDAAIVQMRARPRVKPRFPTVAPICCTASVKHLLGIRHGALRPDALYRHCRAIGGEIVDGRNSKAAESSA